MIDEIPVDMGLDFPDSVNPFLKRHILLYPPHQGHSGVRMHIDKGRHCCFALTINHFYTGSGNLSARITSGSDDSCNHTSFNVNIRYSSVANDILQ